MARYWVTACMAVILLATAWAVESDAVQGGAPRYDTMPSMMHGAKTRARSSALPGGGAASTASAFAVPVQPGRRYALLLAGVDRDPRSSDRDRRLLDHTDTLVLLTTKAGSGIIDAIHIPRDTRVTLGGVGDIKINELMWRYGESRLCKTVAELTGISVNRVMQVDFERFRQAVTLVGGVPFELDRPVATPDVAGSERPGTRRLSAAQALAVVRFRHEPLGDIARVHRQERFLRQVTTIAGHLPLPVFRRVMTHLDGSLSADEIDLAYDLLQSSPHYRAHSVPGNFSVGPGASYWLADHAGMQAISELIREPEREAGPVFSRWVRTRGSLDADDGRDRSY